MQLCSTDSAVVQLRRRRRGRRRKHKKVENTRQHAIEFKNTATDTGHALHKLTNVAPSTPSNTKRRRPTTVWRAATRPTTAACFNGLPPCGVLQRGPSPCGVLQRPTTVWRAATRPITVWRAATRCGGVCYLPISPDGRHVALYFDRLCVVHRSLHTPPARTTHGTAHRSRPRMHATLSATKPRTHPLTPQHTHATPQRHRAYEEINTHKHQAFAGPHHPHIHTHPSCIVNGTPETRK
jgi:hypothetical protein